jgi:hypothetical protein
VVFTVRVLPALYAGDGLVSFNLFYLYQLHFNPLSIYMGLRQKKQHKQRSDAMDSAPPEKMDQADALREFIERVDVVSKNNYFSVNLEFAVSFLGPNF